MLWAVVVTLEGLLTPMGATMTCNHNRLILLQSYFSLNFCFENLFTTIAFHFSNYVTH